ncbi:DUF2155 domain-containing protein [Commensalibacter sp. M0134]|uniref:DUF2155 domain-containing protein n=1 Tax=Commensalibacter TaxID=1079922 RepID=UPI0018DE3948|nr:MULTISPECIES: DUF2155 domain-containing protein [Commensalibacter]MBI0066041.1 DUF2155 domain-containing protein [Commensalibacter sp. M0134]MBI0069924.1 DUF2155 domain-containing protein [Commensalibacter sp. M0133]MBI0080473.1 DUF2155 domain-containing protein [Commensalibacter melissae]
MKKYFCCLAVVILGIGNISSSLAETSKSAKQNPNVAEQWIRQSEAVVRILNKLEAHTEILNIPVGQSVRYQTLTIEALNCVIRPPSTPFDSAAFLQVTDTKLTSIHFASWMFLTEPGIAVFEHPLYNISVVGCAGNSMNDPKKVEKKEEKNIQHPVEQSSESIENSLEKSLQSQH